MEFILLIIALIGYGIFLRNGFLPIVSLVEYSKEYDLDIFGKQYKSSFFAISDPGFMAKLWSAKNNVDGTDPKLDKMIQVASKQYRLLMGVNFLLFVFLFVLLESGVFR